MALAASCPRCTRPLSGDGAEFACDDHGVVAPLWRSTTVDYASFVDVLARAEGIPTYLPWPMSPGWQVSDFGCVATDQRFGLATVTTTCGTSELDGSVEVTVVTEEPGVGLGSRIAGTGVDAGSAVGNGAPTVRLRVDSRAVSLWSVPTAEDDDVLARSVFVGEAGGRWLWLVLRPASAALLLRDDWLFTDASGFGPQAIDLPFGGPPASW